MKKNLYKENLPDSNISITAYRALLVLGLLISSPQTKNEIISKLKNNPLTSKSFSPDTLRVTINTLKAAGCLISRPTIKNGFTYNLVSHPFKFNISQKQALILNQIRKDFISSKNWETVLCINKLYSKIAQICRNDEVKNILKEGEPLSNVSPEILNTLLNPKINSKEIIIDYLSAKNGIEELVIIPIKIFFENSKLYIWCYLKKYNNESYLRVDKIKSIKLIGITPSEINESSHKIFYEIEGDSVTTFIPLDNEKITERTSQNIIVESGVINEFKILQRLLSFGHDLVDVYPVSLKNKLLNKLKLIEKEYSDV